MNCARTERRLADYVDDELSVEARIAVDGHLADCDRCVQAVREQRALSVALRQAGDGHLDLEVIERLRASRDIVLSRVSAEREVARTTGLRGLADNIHRVWIAGVAGAVTVACAVAAAGVVSAASVRSPDSLAALMVALSNPGSNENPVRLRTGMAAPQLSPDAMLLTLPDPMPLPGQPAGVTLSVVVTREGTVAEIQLLGSLGSDPAVWLDLVDSASTARFAPALHAGAPVAVNMVWVVEQVTIQGGRTPEAGPPAV